jgi:hypothetical protein
MIICTSLISIIIINKLDLIVFVDSVRISSGYFQFNFKSELIICLIFNVTRTSVIIRFILRQIVLYENDDEQQTQQHLFFFKEKKKRRKRRK